MELQERHVGAVVVLDLSGELTLADGSERLKDKINSLLLQEARQVLINLGDVSYIDSGGLGQLVSSFSSVKRQGGNLKLFNLGKQAQDLLAITKLLMVFDTYDSEEEAVQSFEGIVRLTRPAAQCPDAPSTIPLPSASLSV